MSGKTTLGKALAEKLERPFIDTDRLIEIAYEKTSGNALSAREIYQKEGDPLFRTLEKKVLLSLQPKREVVLATGGGTPLDPENALLLKKLGAIFYLKTLPEIVWKRVQCRGIPATLNPAHPESDFYRMATERPQVYENLASLHFNLSEKAPDWLATRLVTSFE